MRADSDFVIEFPQRQTSFYIHIETLSAIQMVFPRPSNSTLLPVQCCPLVHSDHFDGVPSVTPIVPLNHSGLLMVILPNALLGSFQRCPLGHSNTAPSALPVVLCHSDDVPSSLPIHFGLSDGALGHSTGATLVLPTCPSISPVVHLSSL